MTDRSSICDSIRRAANATVANRLADLLNGGNPQAAFMQRIGSRWALMFGGDHIAFESNFIEVRNRLAKVLDH